MHWRGLNTPPVGHLNTPKRPLSIPMLTQKKNIIFLNFDEQGPFLGAPGPGKTNQMKMKSVKGSFPPENGPPGENEKTLGRKIPWVLGGFWGHL